MTKRTPGHSGYRPVSKIAVASMVEDQIHSPILQGNNYGQRTVFWGL